MKFWQRKSAPAKTVIYTAIYGGKNDLLEPEFDIPDCDLICFTDNSELKSQKFQVIHLPGYFPQNPSLSAKVFKVVPHHYLQQYQRSLWIDGRVQLLTPDIAKLIDQSLQQHKWATFIHTERATVHAEAAQCIDWNLDDPNVINAQIARYDAEGFPDSAPLTIGGVHIRQHMDPEVIRTGETWWHEILTGSIRDQLSLNYTFWKHNLEVNVLQDNFRDNRYFKLLKHNFR